MHITFFHGTVTGGQSPSIYDWSMFKRINDVYGVNSESLNYIVLSTSENIWPAASRIGTSTDLERSWPSHFLRRLQNSASSRVLSRIVPSHLKFLPIRLRFNILALLNPLSKAFHGLRVITGCLLLLDCLTAASFSLMRS